MTPTLAPNLARSIPESFALGHLDDNINHSVPVFWHSIRPHDLTNIKLVIENIEAAQSKSFT